MRSKQTFFIFTLAILLTLMSGCTSCQEELDPDKEITSILEEMTLDEKIGQLVVVGFGDTIVDEHVETMIKDHKVGGLLLFERNINDTNQLQELIAGLKEINESNSLPLFIAIDEEGGRVSRLPDSSQEFPSNLEIGEENDEDYSFAVGQSIGTELAKFGFNMNLAPVLDILSNPDNSVIGDRSFGDNPEIVSRLGIATMKGLQSRNIVSVVKHFPGHGDTRRDSHIDLPVVNHDRDRLDNFEFLPFKQAITNGAEGIMTAHIIFSQLDAGKPATLSKEILTNILRNEFGFQGLIITDDLEMGAITQDYTPEQAALAAVLAGADIVLVSHNQEQQRKVLDRLKEAVYAGELTEERVNESVARIIELKLRIN